MRSHAAAATGSAIVGEERHAQHPDPVAERPGLARRCGPTPAPARPAGRRAARRARCSHRRTRARADRDDDVVDGGAVGVLDRLDLGERQLAEREPAVRRDAAVERVRGGVSSLRSSMRALARRTRRAIRDVARPSVSAPGICASTATSSMLGKRRRQRAHDARRVPGRAEQAAREHLELARLAVGDAQRRRRRPPAPAPRALRSSSDAHDLRAREAVDHRVVDLGQRPQRARPRARGSGTAPTAGARGRAAARRSARPARRASRRSAAAAARARGRGTRDRSRDRRSSTDSRAPNGTSFSRQRNGGSSGSRSSIRLLDVGELELGRRGGARIEHRNGPDVTRSGAASPAPGTARRELSAASNPLPPSRRQSLTASDRVTDLPSGVMLVRCSQSSAASARLWHGRSRRCAPRARAG